MTAALVGARSVGVLLRQDVIPLASVYALLMVMLARWLRAGRPRGADRRRGASDSGEPSAGRFGGYVATTAAAGFVVFLLIDGIYYWLLGGQPRSFLVQAVWGGAFLAFGVALPVFLLAGWASRHRRVR